MDKSNKNGVDKVEYLRELFQHAEIGSYCDQGIGEAYRGW